MAPRLVHKNAVETPDGLLKDFNTPTPYVPGSIVYVRNGRSYVFGYVEGGGTVVHLTDAPLVGDVVSFWYTQP